MYHLMRGVMTPPAASIPSEREVTSRRSWVVLFLTTNTDGVGVTDELGLFTPAADSSCWHSKDGAVGRRILAGTVLGAHVRVGLWV